MRPLSWAQYGCRSSHDHKYSQEGWKVLHRSTYRSLTPNELLEKSGSDTQDQFMDRVYEKLWSQLLSRELEDVGLKDTPQYDLYEDDRQNKQTFSQLAEELKPM